MAFFFFSLIYNTHQNYLIFLDFALSSQYLCITFYSTTNIVLIVLLTIISSMKNCLLLILCIGITLNSLGQIINIPDQNFLNALLHIGADRNGDAKISVDEAELITFMDVSDKMISDLTGIEHFTNLDTLYCFWNNLPSLNISNLNRLIVLNCNGNNLSSLDLSNNKELQHLNCNHNVLTELDLSQNTKLTTLICGCAYYISDCYKNNLITHLNLSTNINLETLLCGSCQLSSLNIANNYKLKELYCGWNALSSIDVKNKPHLELLSCNDNKISELNLSNDTSLKYLECSNNLLTTLNISCCSSINNLGIASNPNLTNVYVWESFPSNVEVHDDDSYNINYITTDCFITHNHSNKSNKHFITYPNPATRIIYIPNKQFNATKLEIYSSSGKLILSKNLYPYQKTLNISNLYAGFYIVKYYTNNQTFTAKLVVKR